jgi:hypothetical protein
MMDTGTTYDMVGYAGPANGLRAQHRWARRVAPRLRRYPTAESTSWASAGTKSPGLATTFHLIYTRENLN